MPKKLKTEELNRLSVDEFKHAKKFPIVVILDNIRSLSNIGSVFSFFGILNVIDTKIVHEVALAKYF